MNFVTNEIDAYDPTCQWMSVSDQVGITLKKAFSKMIRDDAQESIHVFIYTRAEDSSRVRVGLLDKESRDMVGIVSVLESLGINVIIKRLFSVPSMAGMAKPLLTQLLKVKDSKLNDARDEEKTISQVVRTLCAFRGLCSEPPKSTNYVAKFLANSYEFATDSKVPVEKVYKRMLDLVFEIGQMSRVDADEFVKILEYLQVPLSADADGNPVLDNVRPISRHSQERDRTLENVNVLYAGWNLGLNTQGQSLKNPNLQLRSEFPNPHDYTGPWNNSTIESDFLVDLERI